MDPYKYVYRLVRAAMSGWPETFRLCVVIAVAAAMYALVR